jgi:hypothetical protein
MDFHMKLPRNAIEMALFMAIVSVLSVNVIAPLITFFECGFHLFVYARVLRVIPVVWACVIVTVLVTLKPAEWLTRKIVREGDSFRAFILANIVSSVFFMSIILTVVGTWVGNRKVSLDPILGFFYKWPRNFAISFAIEALFAQPIARFVLYRMHVRKDAKAERDAA